MALTNLVIQTPGLSSQIIEQAAAIAEAQGVVRLGTSAARLLGVADETAIRQEIRAWGEQNLIDAAFVPAGTRLADCKVLAMDMDSTLINIECIDEIAAFGGVKEQVASITEAAMRGEIKDFAESLTRRVAFLHGLSTDVLQAVYDQKLQLNPGAERLLEVARPRVEVRLEEDGDAAVGEALPRGRERRRDLRRVVGVVVDDGDAARDALEFHAPLDAGEGGHGDHRGHYGRWMRGCGSTVGG